MKKMCPKDEQKKSHKSKQDESELSDEDVALFLQSVERIQPDHKYKSVNEVNRTDNSGELQKRRRDAKFDAKIDLHGYTLADATQVVLRGIEGILRSSKKRPIRIRIVTGRGVHSGAGGGVLVRGIYAVVMREYRGRIKTIDVDPGESTLEGFPLRGHFDVTFF